MVPKSLSYPCWKYAGSDYKIGIITYDTPEQGKHESHTFARNQIPIIGGKQPFAHPCASRSRTDNKDDPYHKLAGKDHHLVSSRSESDKKSAHHQES